MFGSEILEVAVGLVFVYLLISLIATAILEGMQGLSKTRAVHLARGIQQLLNDPQLAKNLYRHPLIGNYLPSISENEQKKPSYISSRSFALALMDLITQGKDITAPSPADASVPISFDRLRASIGNIGNVPLQRTLLVALDTANGDLNKALENIEAWYNGAMDRLSDWFKQRAQGILFVIGLILSFAMNANTITIVTDLYKNDTKRQVLVAEIESSVKQAGLDSLSAQRAYTKLDSLNVLAGWSRGWTGTLAYGKPKDSPLCLSFLLSLLGWSITAFAVTFGAPFWFDMLNKIILVRSALKPGGQSQPTEQEKPQSVTVLVPQTASASSKGETPSSFQSHEWEKGNPQEGLL